VCIEEQSQKDLSELSDSASEIDLLWEPRDQEKRTSLRERNYNSVPEVQDSPPPIQHLHLTSQEIAQEEAPPEPVVRRKTIIKIQKNKSYQPKAQKAAVPTTYRRVSRDLSGICKDSQKTSFHTRRYSDILRNQLIRAHTHSLLEFALRFEGYRKKNPYNKDPTWFLEKAATDLFVFSDELQGVSNLSEADRRITHIDFDEIAQPANIGPFFGFQDPRQTVKHFADRISS